MAGNKGIQMLLVVLVFSILQSVSSISICSQGSETGRPISLSGKHGEGTDCRCTLQLSGFQQFDVIRTTFGETKEPTGCQYALRFKLGSSTRTYTCSQNGNITYSMYHDDNMTIEIVSGSTSSGGFDFDFIISTDKSGEISLSCQQIPPDPTASTVISLSTTSTSQTTTTDDITTATSSTQSTSSGGLGNSQTTASGGGTTASGGGTTASGGGTTASGGETTASAGETSASGSATTSSNNKPPTPKPSISDENTDEPRVILVTTEKAPQSTEPTKVSTAAIIGATLGVILLFVVMVVVLLCLWKKKLAQNKVGAS